MCLFDRQRYGWGFFLVYTAKMMFGIDDLVKKGFFSRSTKILAIHTGGLQGISGMNDYLKKNNLELIT